MQSTIQRPLAERRPHARPSFRRAHVVVVALLALTILATIVYPEKATDIGPMGVLLGYGSAGTIILRKLSRIDRREKKAWALMGAGFVVAAIGIFLVALIQAMTGSVAAFGPPDALFILSYVLVIAGLVSLPHFPVGLSQRIRIYLDSLIGAVSMAALMWIITLEDLIGRLENATAWEKWAGTAYPVADVAALIVVVIVSVRRSTFRFDPRLVFFSLGLILQAIADLRFLDTGIGNTLTDAQPNFAAFLLASMCYTMAAASADRPPRPRAYAERKTPLWAVATPYTVAVGLMVTLATAARGATMEPHLQILLAATFCVGGLVIARQTVAIRENRRLVEKQRTDLVSSISHELRTPLTAVVGFLDVLNDEESPVTEQERRELSKLAGQQARHMSRIVADLILLARGSPDEMTLKEEVVTVEQIATEATHASGQFGVNVETDVESGLKLRVDPGRVQQVLLNLVSNAARYGDGKALIVLGREGSDLILEVHDDGPGVPKKYETVIWERFERGMNRLNGAIPGSGIGLAVVSAVATAHGGRTGYQASERLGGACFRVILPDRVLPS